MTEVVDGLTSHSFPASQPEGLTSHSFPASQPEGLTSHSFPASQPEGLTVLPVRGIGEVTPGADLAGLITTAAPWLRDGDVLVVTSKIVSKAEGQLVDMPPPGPRWEAAREELLAAETARVVARRGLTRIVQTHHGFVMASAGIDASNVDSSRLVLLPKDPDASARGLRADLRDRHGLDVAVIVSDTMGRPWRNGLTDVALGVAGLDAIRDYRGEVDPYGNTMVVTEVAVVDELAGAAELVKGKFDQVPVAVVRGFHPAGRTTGAGRTDRGDGTGAASLVRAAQQDLFSLGTAEARAAGLGDAATLTDATPFGDGPVDEALVGRVVAGVRTAPSTTFAVGPAADGAPQGTALVVVCTGRPEPAALHADSAEKNASSGPNADSAEKNASSGPNADSAEKNASSGPNADSAEKNASSGPNADSAEKNASSGPIALGMDVHRLRCALAAAGLASTWVPDLEIVAVGPPVALA